MFTKCRDVIGIMNSYANPILAEEWDNVGLIVGDENTTIKKILVALDIDDKVIQEAIDKECQMIITHHPLIFKGVKKITSESQLGSRLIRLIENKICVFSAHTNLDVAENGTNDTLAALLNLTNVENLFQPKEGVFGLGRIGKFQDEISLLDVSQILKKKLNLNNLVVCGDLEKPIKKVAICTGSGGELSFISQAAKKNCDLYITGDLKYHNSQFAKDLGICLIDATHYATEVIIVPIICEYINNCFKRLNINSQCIESEVNGQTLNIV